MTASVILDLIQNPQKQVRMMKCVKLIQCNVKIEDFVTFWRKAYDDSDEKYKNHINKHPKSEKDIIALYEWKNGGRLSERKRKSLQTKILRKLGIINNLSQDLELDKFFNEFRDVSAIWKLFLLHVIQPESYPMLDQYVMRAYYFLTEGSINKNLTVKEKDKLEFYKRYYLSFFNGLADQVKSKHSRKHVDEALWAFGKFLKSSYTKMIFT